MKTFINKDNLVKVMSDEASDQGVRSTAGILLALVEIREAIEEGCERIDQTNIDTALMLVGCKENLDAFLNARLKADKVLASIEGVVRAAASTQDKASADLVVAAAEVGKMNMKIHKNYQDWRKGLDEVVKTPSDGFDSGKGPEDDESPDEQKKSGVSQEEEDFGPFGPIPYGSGKT